MQKFIPFTFIAFVSSLYYFARKLFGTQEIAFKNQMIKLQSHIKSPLLSKRTLQNIGILPDFLRQSLTYLLYKNSAFFDENIDVVSVPAEVLELVELKLLYDCPHFSPPHTPPNDRMLTMTLQPEIFELQ